MNNSTRLRDLLAVLSCAVIIGAMVLPGLLAARERTRDQTCRDHLRSLGLAFAKFEQTRGGLPPRRTGFNDGNPYGGWGSMIIPYVEEARDNEARDNEAHNNEAREYKHQYDFFDPANKAIVESPGPTFQCPSSPAGRVVLIQSQASTKSLNPDKDTVFECRASATDFIASNGVLLTRNGYGIHALGDEGGIGNQRQPMSDNVISPLSKVTDGLANTLLLIEQAGRPSAWRNRTEKPGAGQFGVSPNARGAWAGWGSIAFGAANSETGETPGRGDHTDCSVNCNNWFGIYSFHPQGGHVLMCDGSVRFASTKLDPLTFAYLTIRDDGRMVRQEDYVDEGAAESSAAIEPASAPDRAADNSRVAPPTSSR